jgi:hypothetical protein
LIQFEDGLQFRYERQDLELTNQNNSKLEIASHSRSPHNDFHEISNRITL